MRYGKGYTGIALAMLLFAGCASSGTQSTAQDEKLKNFDWEAWKKQQVEQVTANLDAKLKKQWQLAPSDKSVLWRVHAWNLQYNDLTGLRLISPDKLLVSIDGVGPRLLNADKGTLLWAEKTLIYDESELARRKEDEKFPPAKYPSNAFIIAYKDMLFFRADGDKGSKILAMETVTGNKRWGAELKKSGELLFIPFPAIHVLAAIQQDKRRAILTTYNLSTGTVVWKSEIRYGSGTVQPPAPASDGNALWIFYDGVTKLSAATGKIEWQRSEIMSGEQSPPMQLDKGRLIVVDRKNSLHILDGRSGKTLASARQREAAVYTNIFPIGDRVYLRGLEKEMSGEPRFFVAAVRGADAKELWIDTDKDPSVSNLIEENRTLYFSTPFTVIALDRETGSRRFAVRASDVGKTFPVQIKKYDEKIIYIGELVIAAFNAKTGAKVYRHGFDPVNQTAHMDALNEAIESKRESLSWFTGPLSDWDFKGLGMSEFFFQQSAYSQNQSNYASQQAAKYGRSSKNTGNSLDATRSDIKAHESLIDSSFARAQWSAGMAFMTVENVQKNAAQATAEDRKRLQELLRIRKLLYAAYVVTQQGDYVYRPTSEAGVVGISVIHLPSGLASYTELTPEYNEIGIFSLISVDKGIVYHPGIQKKPEVEAYFIARPVAIPK